MGAMTRHAKCFHGDRISTCRALAPLGLPKSAGITRRPILLQQSAVLAELRQIAEIMPRKILEKVLPALAPSSHGVRAILLIRLICLDPSGALLRPRTRAPFMVDKEYFG